MTKPLLLLLICLGAGLSAFADEIEFPEEELARETTLPVFEQRRVVLNRHVITEKRFELGIGGGLEMNEPYYSDYMADVMGTYNFNETSALNVQGLMWMQGLSSYGLQLKSGAAKPYRESFDASKAPHPKYGLFVNYEYIAYYGKISITKQGVMNLNLFATGGLGYINMGAVSSPGLNLGIGQNFFFTKNVGLRMDLRYLIFRGPNATTQHLRSTTANNDAPVAGAFGNQMFYNSQLGLTLVFLL